MRPVEERCRPLVCVFGVLAVLVLIYDRGRVDLYRAYALTPSVALADTAQLEGKNFTVTGYVERTSGGPRLRQTSGPSLPLTGPDATLSVLAPGEEYLIDVRQQRGTFLVLKAHPYRGLTRNRVGWSLLPVPVIALLFLCEFRRSGRRFTRRRP